MASFGDLSLYFSDRSCSLWREVPPDATNKLAETFFNSRIRALSLTKPGEGGGGGVGRGNYVEKKPYRDVSHQMGLE